MAVGTQANILRLLQDVGKAACRCPAHSQAFRLNQPTIPNQHARSSTGVSQPEYAFEMACSNIRYGKGVTKEVGMDFRNLGAKKVCVMTDKTIASLPIMTAVLESLYRHHVSHDVFQNVRVEPTDVSFKEAIAFAKDGGYDAYLAVGGGSVMDTCKAANLYASNPEADFLDFVNAPVGKGMPVRGEVKPLLAVPTTAGTGSETTGVAIFDYLPLRAKTERVKRTVDLSKSTNLNLLPHPVDVNCSEVHRIGSRAIRPLLGIVDPLHVMHMPPRVATYSGFDVLCHALESYTAIAYDQRTPRPSNPIERPAYQGSNPISDIWCTEAMRSINKYFKRSIKDPEDFEARSAMHLASVFAGVGFGNAGVHLCHGMSYPIAGMVKNFQAEDYKTDHPIIPHGLSVVMTAPAVFEFTAPMCPERHLKAAELLGADITNVKKKDAGQVVADLMREYMYDLNVDDGLAALGYTEEDIPDLVQGTLPQKRVTKLAPREQTEEDLAAMFKKSMKVY